MDFKNFVSNILGIHNLKDLISLVKDITDIISPIIAIYYGKKLHSRNRQIKKMFLINNIRNVNFVSVH